MSQTVRTLREQQALQALYRQHGWGTMPDSIRCKAIGICKTEGGDSVCGCNLPVWHLGAHQSEHIPPFTWARVKDKPWDEESSTKF
jgi:hypothetical protein